MPLFIVSLGLLVAKLMMLQQTREQTIHGADNDSIFPYIVFNLVSKLRVLC